MVTTDLSMADQGKHVLLAGHPEYNFSIAAPMKVTRVGAVAVQHEIAYCT